MKTYKKIKILGILKGEEINEKDIKLRKIDETTSLHKKRINFITNNIF